MSTDDQSTPTPMAVERRHVLMPAAALADLLGAGFYLPRTTEILDSYGGWTTGAKQEADSLPARIHDDYLRNCQNSRRAEIHERVLSAAYIPQAVFLEVLYFVTIVSDCLCQSSGTRSLYLRHREGAQKRLFSVLPAIVGEVNVSEVDAGLAERSTQYGTDPTRAAARTQHIRRWTDTNTVDGICKGSLGLRDAVSPRNFWENDLLRTETAEVGGSHVSSVWRTFFRKAVTSTWKRQVQGLSSAF